jgi:hypothetical protein
MRPRDFNRGQSQSGTRSHRGQEPRRAARTPTDRVVFADFIPNNWSAWPDTYQHVDVLEHGPERAIIRAERDWGSVTIPTVYTLKASSDHIEIQTAMTNRGSTALPDLLSGLTLWPNSGFVLRIPGLADTEQGKADGGPLPTPSCCTSTTARCWNFAGPFGDSRNGRRIRRAESPVFQRLAGAPGRRRWRSNGRRSRAPRRLETVHSEGVTAFSTRAPRCRE